MMAKFSRGRHPKATPKGTSMRVGSDASNRISTFSLGEPGLRSRQRHSTLPSTSIQISSATVRSLNSSKSSAVLRIQSNWPKRRRRWSSKESIFTISSVLSRLIGSGSMRRSAMAAGSVKLRPFLSKSFLKSRSRCYPFYPPYTSDE